MVQGYSPQATRALLFRAYLDVNYSKLSKSGGHSAKGGWQKCADAHIIGEKIHKYVFAVTFWVRGIRAWCQVVYHQ